MGDGSKEGWEMGDIGDSMGDGSKEGWEMGVRKDGRWEI